MDIIRIGEGFEHIVDWMQVNLKPLWSFIKLIIESLVDVTYAGLAIIPAFVLIIFVAFIAFKFVSNRMAVMTVLGLGLIYLMGYWDKTMITLSMVLISTMIALLIGVPTGIWSARNENVNQVVRPILDFMQTMPAYVYLIPAVLFFNLGTVPGVISTIIFSMPPAVRLTNLGIRQVPEEVIEAALSFGCTQKQLLYKVQLPLAMPTILAGLNQTIMLALSMVVISAMIGAKGLGLEVYNGITQLNIGKGFESGLSIVILAMILDRLTHSLGQNREMEN
ncbi:ABC transporter permease [Fusibacter sp. JL216-2]|uniref:ABC transporter permease n=1 Tax=Fusibacter sp. JL216-2 TaxID=3071453 RepID=UPI003D33F0E1